jgi:DNA polymerase III subunit epsilon
MRRCFPASSYASNDREDFMKIAFFDFEATNSDTKTCRITEVGCVVIDTDTRKELVSFGMLVWDETYEPINPEAAAITGISDALLKAHGNPPRVALAQLGTLLMSADYICGHNIRKFDLPLLEQELKRNLLEFEKLPPNIDTRTDIVYPGHIVTRKLAYLAAEFAIYAGNAHSALSDCNTTAELLFRFPLETTIELSKVPEIYIRADVSFHDKDKAKEKKYFWDQKLKIWVKLIKECFYDTEADTSDFPVIKLPNYVPQE